MRRDASWKRAAWGCWRYGIQYEVDANLLQLERERQLPQQGQISYSLNLVLLLAYVRLPLHGEALHFPRLNEVSICTPSPRYAIHEVMGPSEHPARRNTDNIARA